MSVNKNKFFQRARQKAADILKNQDRLRNLMNSSGEKLKDINFGKLGDSKFVDRIKVVIRMIKAYKNGEYREIQLQNIILMVAALLYFVTPIDLIPDFIPLTGFVDDIGVLVWVWSRMQDEIDDFLLWEEQRSTDS